jgi:hypothetical protein
MSVMVALLAILAGCSPSEQSAQKSENDPIITDALKRTTLGDWMHDIDAAESFTNYVNMNLPLLGAEVSAHYISGKELSPLGKTAVLAFRAMNLTDSGMSKCHPSPRSTATTDHACLDAAGYKRSR